MEIDSLSRNTIRNAMGRSVIVGRRPRKAVGFRWPQIFNPINKEMWVIEVNPPNAKGRIHAASGALSTSLSCQIRKKTDVICSHNIIFELMQKIAALSKVFVTVSLDMGNMKWPELLKKKNCVGWKVQLWHQLLMFL